jgi:cytochrome c5
LCSVVLGFMAPSSSAVAQQKAAKANGAAEAQAAQGRKVYSTIKDLMDSIVDPSADVLWGAVGTVVDQEGVHETFPKTQEEWLNVRRAAVRIIEGANLLMMPGREAAPPGAKSEAPGVELEPPQITALIKKNRKSFDALARALQVLGLEAMRAGEAQDTAALLEIGGRMQDACERCHQAFWYPGAKQPSTLREQQRK